MGLTIKKNIISGTLSELQGMLHSKGYYLHSQEDSKALYSTIDDPVFNMEQKYINESGQFATVFCVESARAGNKCSLIGIDDDK